FIASLDGVADRNAAEALKGAELFVARTRLPDPAAGEFYVNDLVGLPVVRPDGTILGEVAGVANYGAGDLLDVKIAGRRDTALIPLAPPFVTAVEEARVVVDLPEDYLDEGVRPGDA
ncbi:MAG: 16S rRNA processing protein RimM, partial [Rhizobiales bacterium]|nr:16S rRNA processing protein RimM [Hyphomicrobiales bacterium]